MIEKTLVHEIKPQQDVKWWMPEYGFFGTFYMEGDNSVEGYLDCRKQNLAERTDMEAKGVISLLNLSPGSKLLDCPCGYGRHSNCLSEHGIDVVGYDINSVHLEQAIKNAKAKGLKTKFRQGNMLEIDLSAEFDAVINMFYSFGFFDTDEENFKVLVNFYNALKEGGKFLMHTDVNIPRIKSGNYKFDEHRELISGNRLRIVDEYDEATKRINGRWIIKEVSGITRDVDYSVRVYEKAEFVDMCRQAGFGDVKVYADWDGSDYSGDAEDMIVIACK